MKSLLVGFVGTLALGVVASGSFAPVPSQDDAFILRVSATQAGQEIPFEGAFVVSDESSKSDRGPLQLVRQQTPFQIEARGELLYGAFQKLEGLGELRVELLRPAGSEPILSATGRGVILGENVTPRVSSFIRTF